MESWQEGKSFADLLKTDTVIPNYLTQAELEGLFDLEYHTKHIDTIFGRVFGAA